MDETYLFYAVKNIEMNPVRANLSVIRIPGSGAAQRRMPLSRTTFFEFTKNTDPIDMNEIIRGLAKVQVREIWDA